MALMVMRPACLAWRRRPMTQQPATRVRTDGALLADLIIRLEVLAGWLEDELAAGAAPKWLVHMAADGCRYVAADGQDGVTG